MIDKRKKSVVSYTSAKKRKRSLKTKQETSISNIKRYFGKQKKKKRKALELNQMESLILAQDERWRHA